VRTRFSALTVLSVDRGLQAPAVVDRSRAQASHGSLSRRRSETIRLKLAHQAKAPPTALKLLSWRLPAWQQRLVPPCHCCPCSHCARAAAGKKCLVEQWSSWASESPPAYHDHLRWMWILSRGKGVCCSGIVPKSRCRDGVYTGRGRTREATPLSIDEPRRSWAPGRDKLVPSIVITRVHRSPSVLPLARRRLAV
jgi:hypothetical protein